MGVHTNLDPVTGNCIDCGARREEIDDNLYPTCEKITGPHRSALIEIRGRFHRRSLDATTCDHEIIRCERSIAWARASREVIHAELAELEASAAALRALSPQPESPSRVMQRAADAILDPPHS